MDGASVSYTISESRLNVCPLSPLKRRDVRRRNFACGRIPFHPWSGLVLGLMSMEVIIGKKMNFLKTSIYAVQRQAAKRPAHGRSVQADGAALAAGRCCEVYKRVTQILLLAAAAAAGAKRIHTNHVFSLAGAKELGHAAATAIYSSLDVNSVTPSRRPTHCGLVSIFMSVTVTLHFHTYKHIFGNYSDPTA